MRTIVHEGAWIAAAILAVSTSAVSSGCKFGNPMDRSVKVTQQPTVDELESPSPKMRFAAGSLTRENEADTATTKSPPAKALSRSVAGRSPHEPTDSDRSIGKTSVARKAPNSETTKSNRATAETALATSKLSSPVVPPKNGEMPAEHAELLNAFRDSPPEVQQQALRQLLAVTGRGAARTDSPEGIAAALRSSVGNLPTLPDNTPMITALPTRLASQRSPEPEDSEVVTASANDEAESESQSNQVQQASSASLSPIVPEKTDQANSPIPAPEKLTKTRSAEHQTAPVETISTASESDLYAELSRRLATGVAGESDADRYRRQIISRHLMLFSGNPDGAVAAIDGMTASEQEFLRHYLLGVWAMVDESGHPVAARRWTAAVPEMRMATQQLAASAELLDVRSLAFCKEIQSFGQITKFDSSRFEAGQKVILYCEVDNFVAKSTAEGFETHLQGSYEVFDSNDRKVAGQVLPADKQMCANYLRDYFIAYQMSLPSGLEPGEYRLELSMECLKGQKYGQASIPLQIVKSAAK